MTLPTFWRAQRVPVQVGKRKDSGFHLLQVFKKENGKALEAIVLYPSDGYWRLKPLPDARFGDGVYGSSFLLGPVEAGRAAGGEHRVDPHRAQAAGHPPALHRWRQRLGARRRNQPRPHRARRELLEAHRQRAALRRAALDVRDARQRRRERGALAGLAAMPRSRPAAARGEVLAGHAGALRAQPAVQAQHQRARHRIQRLRRRRPLNSAGSATY
jgi:hypothetical protein